MDLTFLLDVRVILEVVLLAVAIYAFISFLQETRGSGVFKGFVLMTVILVFSSLAFVETLDLAHLRFIATNGLQIFLISLTAWRNSKRPVFSSISRFREAASLLPSEAIS